MVHVGLSELFGEQLPLNLMAKNLIFCHIFRPNSINLGMILNFSKQHVV